MLHADRGFQSFFDNTCGGSQPDHGLLLSRLNDRLEELNRSKTAGSHFLVLVHGTASPIAARSSVVCDVEKSRLDQLLREDSGKRIRLLSVTNDIIEFDAFADEVQRCLERWMFV